MQPVPGCQRQPEGRQAVCLAPPFRCLVSYSASTAGTTPRTAQARTQRSSSFSSLACMSLATSRSCTAPRWSAARPVTSDPDEPTPSGTEASNRRKSGSAMWSSGVLPRHHRRSSKVRFLQFKRFRLSPSSGIVEALDVIKGIGSCFATRLVSTAIDALSFEHAEEALARGIVGTAADATSILVCLDVG